MNPTLRYYENRYRSKCITRPLIAPWNPQWDESTNIVCTRLNVENKTKKKNIKSMLKFSIFD